MKPTTVHVAVHATVLLNSSSLGTEAYYWIQEASRVHYYNGTHRKWGTCMIAKLGAISIQDS